MSQQPEPLLHRDDESIDRYLRNKQADAERDAFETRMIEEPDLLARTEAAARLQHALKEYGEARSALQAPTGWWASVARAIQAWAAPAVATAAAVAVFATLMAWREAEHVRSLQAELRALAQQNVEVGDQLTAFRQPTAPAMFEMPLLRGSSDAPDMTIAIPNDSTTIGLVMRAPESSASAVQIHVEHQADGTPTVGPIAAQANVENQVVLLLPVATLAPGDYRISIRPSGAEEEARLYRVRFVKKPLQ